MPNTYTANIRLKAMAEEIRKDPTNPIPWAKRSQLLLEQGDKIAALADARTAWRLDSTRPESYVLLATAYKASLRLDSAAYCIYKAKANGYVSPGLYVIGGEILLITRRYKEALKELDKALDLAPDNAKAYFYKGLVYEEKGDTAAAIRNLQQSLTLNPEYADGHNKLASLYMRKGNWPMAAEHLRSGLRFAPTDAFVNFNLGIYFERQGFNDSAKAYFAKATFYEPSMYLANYKLGMISYTQRNYLDATNRLEAALQYAPDLTEARFFLALSREFMGNYPEAENQYKAVIAQNKGYIKDSKGGLARLETLQARQRRQDQQAALRDSL